MNTLMQMGPMMLMDGNNTGLQTIHHHQPFQPQPSHQHHMLVQQAPITSSMNRSQRCGVCRGCQMKPCGLCTYCQDSPQFGGPGVKKQSCIERRCLRVLENRLQRDAPTFKARVGCNQCEDCRMPDCQICLVCLDKRFFENRYMTGAMCAKKRCNNATSIELPVQSNPHAIHEFQQRQAQKRAYDQVATQSGPPQAGLHFDMKRRAEMPYPVPVSLQMPPQQPPAALGGNPAQARILAINPGNNYVVPQMHRLPMTMPQAQPQHPNNNLPLLTTAPIVTSVSNCTASANGIPSIDSTQPIPPDPTTNSNSTNHPQILSHQNCNNGQQNMISTTSVHMPAAFLVPAYGPHSGLPNKSFDYFPHKTFDFVDLNPNGDPFVPPSYAPDMKNAVVLQPL